MRACEKWRKRPAHQSVTLIAFICSHNSQLRRVGFIATKWAVTRPGIYEILCGKCRVLADMAAGRCHQDHVSTLLHVVHAMFEAAPVKSVVPDALQHITNAQVRSFLRFHDIYMHCRDTVDLFNFFCDVLGGGAWDFWSWVGQCCRAWFIAANHAFGQPWIVELLCFCVTVSSLSLSRWSCDEYVSKFFGGYFLSDAALVKYVVPDSLPPTSHWNEPAFMRLCICMFHFIYLLTRWLCDDHMWKIMAEVYVVSDVQLVKYVVPESLPPSIQSQGPAFMRFWRVHVEIFTHTCRVSHTNPIHIHRWVQW